MTDQQVPVLFPEDVLDPTVSTRLPIHNGQSAAARAVSPLERACYFLHAGLDHGYASGLLTYSSTSTAARQFSSYVRRPPFAAEIEVAVRASLTGAADGDFVTLQLTTDADGTGQTVKMTPVGTTGINGSQRYILRASLGDGTKSSESNSQRVYLGAQLNNSGGTWAVWGIAVRLVPQGVITL